MLLRSFERCQKWIVNYNKLVINLIILVNISLLMNEKHLSANCQVYESNEASNHDLLPSETLAPRQDTVGTGISNPFLGSGLLSSPAIWTLMATIPSKLIGLATLSVLRQQQNQDVIIPGGVNGFRAANCVNGNGRGCNGNNGNNGNNGGNNNGNGGDDDDDENRGRKKTLMFFAGRGNIQVKNHDVGDGGEEADESEEKHNTIQMIDEEKGFANFNKEKNMNGFNNNAMNGLVRKKNNKRWGMWGTRANKFKNLNRDKKKV